MNATIKQLWKLNDLSEKCNQPLTVQLPLSKEQASIQIQTLILQQNIKKMEETQ
jgi:hypothetical protein